MCFTKACPGVYSVRDGPFECVGGGGAGFILVRPSSFLLPESQDIFFSDKLKASFFL